jgi:4'-phosphopantetheinyl transferase
MVQPPLKPRGDAAPTTAWTALDAETVHLWHIDLQTGLAGGSPYDLLSDDERARADRFHQDRDRTRFAVARARLRRILGAYQERNPEDIDFIYSEFGKPALADGSEGHDGLRFNLSHSGDHCLVALARGRDVGIDIEAVTRSVEIMPLATRFFSATESDALAHLPASRRRQGFFTIWTQKEAFVKAKGDGLSRALDSFDVSPDLRQEGSLVTRPDASDAARYTLIQLAPAAGFAGAVAIEGRCGRMDFWRCIDDDTRV